MYIYCFLPVIKRNIDEHKYLEKFSIYLLTNNFRVSPGVDGCSSCEMARIKGGASDSPSLSMELLRVSCFCLRIRQMKLCVHECLRIFLRQKVINVHVI